MIKDYQHDNIKLSFQLSPDKSMVLIAYKLAQIPIIIFFFTWTRSSFWISLNLKSPQSCFSFIFCCFYSTWFCSQEIIQLNRVHSLCLGNSSAVLVPVALCGVTRYLKYLPVIAEETICVQQRPAFSAQSWETAFLFPPIYLTEDDRVPQDYA